MAIGIQPYAGVHSQTGLLDAELLARQQQKMSDFRQRMQKGKMSEKFTEDLERAKEQARIELEKSKPKSSRSKWLSRLKKITGFVPGGQILSGLLGAYQAGDELRTSSKFAKKQAKLARDKALSVSDHWKRTFLGKDYTTNRARQEDYFRDLIKQSDVSKSDLFSTALKGGVSSYAASKLTSKIGEGIKGLKDITSEPSLTFEGEPSGMGKITSETKALMEPFLKGSESLGLPPDPGALGLAEGFDWDKIMESKHPFFKTIGEGFKGGLKDIGGMFGGEGDTKDILTGLLLLLQQSDALEE